MGGVTREDIDNEAMAIAKLCVGSNTNTIVEVLANGWLPHHPTIYYIDMEYCEDTLERYIDRIPQKLFEPKGSFPVLHLAQIEPIISISHQIASGLEYIHKNGSVHRDLKPSNGALTVSATKADQIVLYSPRDQRWKLADLGSVADGTSKHFNTTRYSRGTACYRAPEILKNPAKYNNKADMWALGCIVYELSTREKAFPNDWAILEYSKPEYSSFFSIRALDRSFRKWPCFDLSYLSTSTVYDRFESDIKCCYEDLYKDCRDMLNPQSTSRPSANTFAARWELGVLKLREWVSQYVCYNSQQDNSWPFFPVLFGDKAIRPELETWIESLPETFPKFPETFWKKPNTGTAGNVMAGTAHSSSAPSISSKK